MTTEGTTEPELSIEELKAELERVRSQRDRYLAERDANYENGKKWKSNAEALESQRNGVMDELHRVEIDKARLEGYIDRVREFDPQPEPIMVPQHVGRHQPIGLVDEYLHSDRRPAPWYRRHL